MCVKDISDFLCEYSLFRPARKVKLNPITPADIIWLLLFDGRLPCAARNEPLRRTRKRTAAAYQWYNENTGTD
jgi:hypothetical protein